MRAEQVHVGGADRQQDIIPAAGIPTPMIWMRGFLAFIAATKELWRMA